MASEAKPFASLSSGRLARKGAARPAMKPQGFGQMGAGNLEDLGWNDMGFEPPKPADVARDAEHDAFGEDIVEHPKAHPTGLTPIGSPVHDQQAEIAGRLSGEPEEEYELDETAEVYEPVFEESAVEGTAVEEPVAARPGLVRPRAARGRRRSHFGSIRAVISSCGLPVRSTAARRSSL